MGKISKKGYVNAAKNILNLARQARDGQSRSNATGLATSTLIGETLVEQVARVKVESPCL
ncbi:hypothetical protein [Anabaena sp. CCY 9402-a]|uniref:hypothetical protein n=1 Tax=Anabaena sp. CCY 9402-a TaxID=3103867 RepID=UPI0039C5B250